MSTIEKTIHQTYCSRPLFDFADTNPTIDKATCVLSPKNKMGNKWKRPQAKLGVKNPMAKICLTMKQNESSI